MFNLLNSDIRRQQEFQDCQDIFSQLYRWNCDSRKTQKYQQNYEQSITREEQLIVQARTETRSVQEEKKKDQEHKILSWFTLPQGLRPSFANQQRFPLKRSQ